jgi:hypothetical protein
MTDSIQKPIGSDDPVPPVRTWAHALLATSGDANDFKKL